MTWGEAHVRLFASERTSDLHYDTCRYWPFDLSYRNIFSRMAAKEIAYSRWYRMDSGLPPGKTISCLHALEQWCSLLIRLRALIDIKESV